MSSPEVPAPTPPKVPDWWQGLYPRRVISRIWRLFTQPVKFPGWAAIGTAIVLITDWADRIGYWIEIAQTMGGHMGMIASVVGYRYFPIGLVAAGLLWLYLVGEPSRGVQRHHWWPYFGWSVVAICVTAIIVTAGRGWFEIYLREQITERQAAALHDASRPNAPPRASDPTFDYNRHLSPEQFRALTEVGARLKPFLNSETPLRIAIAPLDYEAGQYRQEFIFAFTRVGIVAYPFELLPDGRTDVGVMIVIRDIAKPPAAAEELRKILEIIGVSTRYVQKQIVEERQFYLYIGPKPI